MLQVILSIKMVTQQGMEYQNKSMSKIKVLSERDIKKIILLKESKYEVEIRVSMLVVIGYIKNNKGGY